MAVLAESVGSQGNGIGGEQPPELEDELEELLDEELLDEELLDEELLDEDEEPPLPPVPTVLVVWPPAP